MDTNEHESGLVETTLGIKIPSHLLGNNAVAAGQPENTHPYSRGFVFIRG